MVSSRLNIWTIFHLFLETQMGNPNCKIGITPQSIQKKNAKTIFQA